MHQEVEKTNENMNKLNREIMNNYKKSFSNDLNNNSISSTDSNSNSVKSSKSFPYNSNNPFSLYNYLIYEKNLIPLFSYNKTNYDFQLTNQQKKIDYPYNQIKNFNEVKYENNNNVMIKKTNKNLDTPRNKIYLENIIRQKDKRTTIMIRHIPNKYSIKLLVNELNIYFKDKYDLIYLPIDIINCCNLGFGFINFTNNFHILSFYEHYYGKKWKKFNSDKKCELAYAKIQGKENLMKNIILSENYNNEKNIPIYYLNQNINKENNISIPLKYLQAFLNFYPFASFIVVDNQSFVVNSFYNF